MFASNTGKGKSADSLMPHLADLLQRRAYNDSFGMLARCHSASHPTDVMHHRQAALMPTPHGPQAGGPGARWLTTGSWVTTLSGMWNAREPLHQHEGHNMMTPRQRVTRRGFLGTAAATAGGILISVSDVCSAPTPQTTYSRTIVGRNPPLKSRKNHKPPVRTRAIARRCKPTRRSRLFWQF